MRRGISKIYLYPAIFMIAVVGLAIVRILALRYGANATPSKPPAAPVVAATVPSTEPASKPAPKLVDLLDVVRFDNPDYPTTQPLDSDVELSDAAKIILDRPVYLDAMGRIWITHESGQDIQDVLRKPIKTRTLIVKQKVLFVHYPLAGKPNIFVDTGENRLDRLSGQRIESFANRPDNRWNEASRFGEDVVVPHDAGVLIYRNGASAADNPAEIRLSENASDHATPNRAILLSTGDSFLAWVPSEHGRAGSADAVHVDQRGQRRLSAQTGWFDQSIHFIPLADGSILGIGRAEDGIRLKLTSMDEPAPRTPEQIEQINILARRLSDRDPRVREKTQRELETLGPSIYPQLEAIRESLPAEAQVRIETILGQRFAPTLAGLRPLEGETKTISRFPDGGCVLLLTGGGVTSDDGADKTIIPAWIAIRPGQYLERLPEKLVEGFVPDKYQFFVYGSEWVVFDPVLGLRRWMGSRLQTLLPKPLRHFDQFIGIDGNKRWLFRSGKESSKTLIIDPSLPDTTPRLPVWIVTGDERAGWTDAGWPAVKRGTRIFVLGEKGWRLLDSDTENFNDTPPTILPTVATDAKGQRYELRGNRVLAGERVIVDDARNATMIFFAENRLFLIASGAIHRFSNTGKLEETFTRRLPSGEAQRAWLDPVGRLVLLDGRTLHIAFPAGRVPREIAALMLSTQEEE